MDICRHPLVILPYLKNLPSSLMKQKRHKTAQTKSKMKLTSLQFAIVALLCMSVLATMVMAQYRANEASSLFEDETFNQFYNGEDEIADDEDDYFNTLSTDLPNFDRDTEFITRLFPKTKCPENTIVSSPRFYLQGKADSYTICSMSDDAYPKQAVVNLRGTGCGGIKLHNSDMCIRSGPINNKDAVLKEGFEIVSDGICTKGAINQVWFHPDANNKNVQFLVCFNKLSDKYAEAPQLKARK